jgi:hypothetical protein
MERFILSVHLLYHVSSTLTFPESADPGGGFGRFYLQIGLTYHHKEIIVTAALHRKM